MKILLVAFALMGIAAAATLPDSATQGPNPQDIATPEPEYIDIDEPAPAPLPAIGSHRFNYAPRVVQQARQISYSLPAVQHIQPQFGQQLPGHYQGQSGYQYRRPVYIRRLLRFRY